MAAKRHSSCLSTDAVGTACERFVIGLKSLDWRGMVFRRASNSSALVGEFNFGFDVGSGGVMILESFPSRISQINEVDD